MGFLWIIGIYRLTSSLTSRKMLDELDWRVFDIVFADMHTLRKICTYYIQAQRHKPLTKQQRRDMGLEPGACRQRRPKPGSNPISRRGHALIQPKSPQKTQIINTNGKTWSSLPQPVNHLSLHNHAEQAPEVLHQIYRTS